MIREDSLVTLSEDCVSTELADEEFVVLNLRDGMYYGLNATGSHIWRLIDEPRSLRDLLDRLVQRFDVDRARCREDLVALLNDLADKGLVRITADG